MTSVSIWRGWVAAFVVLAGFCAASPALAAGEAFRVVSVDTLGCNSGNFGMTVERSNLDGGAYTVRTMVTVGGQVYMNEAATITVNGLSGWSVFNNFTYGTVPNPGTYPIPSGQQMTLEFTLERPIGAILYRWKLVVDGCDTGNIVFNKEVRASVPVPTLPDGAVGLLSAALLLAFAWHTRRRASIARR